MPRRAMAVSLLWHVLLLFVSVPLGQYVAARPRPAPPQVEITWTGPVRDLAPLTAPGPAAKPSPPGDPAKPLSPRGADAYHPRQTVLSLPQRPTHPRQTLIQPSAPAEPPKILPSLPNVVQWEKPAPLNHPSLPISTEVLAQLHPKRRAANRTADVPVPEMPNEELRPAELNIAASAVNDPKPALPLNPGSVAAPQQHREKVQAVAAPDIGGPDPEDPGLHKLISLSATRGLPTPPPPGNVAANLTISPEGTQPGVPGGSPKAIPDSDGGSGGGPNSLGGTGGAGGIQPGALGGGNGIPGPPGLTLTGGGSNSLTSGGGASPATPSPAPLLPSKPEPRPTPSPAGRTPIRPDLDRVPLGQPEAEILGPRRVYTLYVNMPNLTSVTGSWVLNFAQLNEGGLPQPRTDARPDVEGPLPLRKVDPKYPPGLATAHVEGEVVLYAIIRNDGSVDSIRVVKGLDPQLDTNAMQALARWKFRPAMRSGMPIELEAVVHIPFRVAAPSF